MVKNGTMFECRLLVGCIQNNVTGKLFKTRLYTLDGYTCITYKFIPPLSFSFSLPRSLSLTLLSIGYISVHSITISTSETLMELVFLLLEIYSSFPEIACSSRIIINFSVLRVCLYAITCTNCFRFSKTEWRKK